MRWGLYLESRQHWADHIENGVYKAQSWGSAEEAAQSPLALEFPAYVPKEMPEGKFWIHCGVDDSWLTKVPGVWSQDVEQRVALEVEQALPYDCGVYRLVPALEEAK